MLRAVSGFNGAGERVVVAETVIVADTDDFVELVSDGVLPEEGEGIHWRDCLKGGKFCLTFGLSLLMCFYC